MKTNEEEEKELWKKVFDATYEQEQWGIHNPVDCATREANRAVDEFRKSFPTKTDKQV